MSAKATRTDGVDKNRTAYTQVNSKKFHESKACAGKQPIECTVDEAVSAKRAPCAICVSEDVFNWCLSQMRSH